MHRADSATPPLRDTRGEHMSASIVGPPDVLETGKDIDVLVIGAAPGGLALARLRSVRGVRVAVVDPNRSVCQHPRATHLDDETMRALQTLRASDMERLFLRHEGWSLTRPDGRPFLEIAMPNVESDQGWYTDYQFHQPDFESRLRGLLCSGSQAALWAGWTATDVDQDGDGVRVTITERDTEATRVLRAAYAVGADGAGSMLRAHIAQEVVDYDGTQTSLIIDVYPFEHPAALPANTGFIRCGDELPVTYLPIFPPYLRFEFMMSPDQDAHDMARPANVYKLLAQWLEPGSYRITRTDAYEWHAR